LLLGHEDHAETPFADLLQQLIGASIVPGRSLIGSSTVAAIQMAGFSRNFPALK
jgi:hypothetical protein